MRSARSLLADNAMIKVLVGPDATEFFVPGLLLKESSTFFAAALRGPFLEAHEQAIILDDEDVGVFKTYLVWLYHKILTTKDMTDYSADIVEQQTHLVRVYAFADKRGVPLLGNCAITLAAVSFYDEGETDASTIIEAYRILRPESPLCVAIARCELLANSSNVTELYEGTIDAMPRAFICQIVRDAAEHIAVQETDWPSDHICDYHDPTENDEAACRARVEDCK